MAVPTYLDLVNSVIARMRENPVTSVSATAYSRLVGVFINQAKDEIEESWDWSVLRETVRLTTLPGEWLYTATDAGPDSRVLNVYNNSEDYEIFPEARDRMTQLLTANNVESGQPFKYDINFSGPESMQFNFWPIPDGVWEINIDMVIPSPALSSDTDQLYLPARLVRQRAYVLAQEERGDIGQAALEREDRNFQKSLTQAITTDLRKHPFEEYAEID